MRVETTAAGERLAVSRNISRTGLLMATAARLELGAPVTLRFRLEPHGPREHSVEGRIVRFAPNDEDPDGLWPFMVAVEFAEPSALLEAVLLELEDGAAPGDSPSPDEGTDE